MHDSRYVMRLLTQELHASVQALMQSVETFERNTHHLPLDRRTPVVQHLAHIKREVTWFRILVENDFFLPHSVSAFFPGITDG